MLVPMQAPAHRQGERAFAGEHGRRMAAEICFEILRLSPLFHTKFDGINGIGRIDGMVGRLVGLDEVTRISSCSASASR